MKKGYILLIVLLVFSLMTSAAVAEDLKVIKLVYSNNAPAKHGGNIFFDQQWLPRVNAKLAQAGYKIEFTSYHASSLYKYKDQVNACEKGLIDVTNFIVSWEEARAPLHMVLNLPLMGYTAHSNVDIWFDLQQTIPEFGAEFSKYKELFHFATIPAVFNMNKVRRVPDDFKGVKVYATGAMAELFKSIGASPLRIDPTDWYTSMDRGLIDVLPMGIFNITMWKLSEVAKVHVLTTGDALSWTNLSYIMNREEFDKLPAVVQKAIDDNVHWASMAMTDIDEGNRANSEKQVEAAGNTVVRLTQEEMDLWRAAAIPVHKQWIKEMEDRNLPGQKVYDTARLMIKEYKD